MVQEERTFKDISYLELWWPFCSAEQNHWCNFEREWQEEHFCEIILNLDRWFRRRCILKIFLSWSSCGFFAQRRKISCSNFGREYQEDQFCEIILNLERWFRRRCRLKIFLIWSSDSPFVQWSGTICAIVVDGIIRINSVKLF